MGNSIVVTRAPRLISSPWESIQDGTYYLMFGVKVGGMRQSFVARKHQGNGFVISNEYLLDYELPNVGGAVCFPDFDAMCRWVAGGRRLEDLQGDASSEWVPAADLPLHSYGTLAVDYGNMFVGDVVFKTVHDTYPITSMRTGQTWKAVSLCQPSLVIWPLNPALGDSITITATK